MTNLRILPVLPGTHRYSPVLCEYSRALIVSTCDRSGWVELAHVYESDKRLTLSTEAAAKIVRALQARGAERLQPL